MEKTGWLVLILILFGTLGVFYRIIGEGEIWISLIYFTMRPIHYWVVFYNDFKKKIYQKRIVRVNEKIRYIKLALLNYVKINLEFCILVYLLKYLKLAFINIEARTFLETIYYIIVGELSCKTNIEIITNLLRISTLAIIITLNLATYMALEVKKND